MKFTINSKTLATALNAVGRVVPAKPTIQILGSYLFSVAPDAGCIQIIASDTENRAAMLVDIIDSEGEGDFCIDARFIGTIIRNLPDCPVTIEVNDSQVLITTDSNSFSGAVTDAAQFPESKHERSENAVVFDIATDKLLAGFNDVQFAVGNDDFQQRLMGVCVDVKPESLTFVGTDTRILAKSVSDFVPGVEAQFILPRTAISALSLLAAKESTLSVEVNPTDVVFYGHSFTLWSQLLKGPYPDYNRVIPQNNPWSVIISPDSLQAAVRRVSACADSEYSIVKFIINGDKMNVKARDLAMGREAQETIDCESNGVDMTIGFSGKMLPLVLSAFPHSEKIEIRLSDLGRPGVFYAVGEDQHLTLLLMPMNVK